MTGIDDALLRLRRLWSPARTRVIDDQGVPVEMSSLLVVEACARAAGREATIGDVAEFADVAPSTASRLVDRAERAGLVHRLPSVRNARRTAVALSPAGAELQKRARAFRTGWLRDCLRDWPEGDVAEFSRLLSRFASAVEHGRPRSPAG